MLFCPFPPCASLLFVFFFFFKKVFVTKPSERYLARKRVLCHHKIPALKCPYLISPPVLLFWVPATYSHCFAISATMLPCLTHTFASHLLPLPSNLVFKACHGLAPHVSRLDLVVLRCSVGKRKDAGSTPHFSSPFSSKIVIYGHCLVNLPYTINEMAPIAAHLNSESFWW